MMHAQLQSIDIQNFRSIRGHVHAPLDAKVVLMHGENGAGKTSLLSAIQLGLTGQIDALQRADPKYELQLLHKRTLSGYAEVKVGIEKHHAVYRADLSPGKVTSTRRLNTELAEFFAERAYLPQSLLGQLLQIYQEPGSGADSPLARFVSSLLGLDRLDALEAGLGSVHDVRNLRRVANQWSHTEKQKDRHESTIDAQRSNKAPIVKTLASYRLELTGILKTLDLQADENFPENQANGIGRLAAQDETQLGDITDRLRFLASVRREMVASEDDGQAEEKATSRAREAASALSDWRESNDATVSDIRSRLEKLFPDVAFPSDLTVLYGDAKRLLSTEQEQLAANVQRLQDEANLLVQARDQLDVATTQLNRIDREMSAISADTGALSAALAEMASFITDDLCPVCGRDYVELDAGSLADHLHERTRVLSSSAERLILLGKSRNQQQSATDRLNQQIDRLAGRQIDPQQLADQDRRATDLGDTLRLLESVHGILGIGQGLIESDIAARRELTQIQQRNSSRLAVRGNLEDLAGSTKMEGIRETETLVEFAFRIEQRLTERRSSTDARVRSRARASDLVAEIGGLKKRIEEIDRVISEQQASLKLYEGALIRGRQLRTQAQTIASAVDTVRSTIIRREFNDRLNKLWRDLFVRLAPGETFVPAFRIPTKGTQKLQPTLYTPDRDLGDEAAGGTPGAMLSAGNLNTAALTLFIALHLSVPVQLPWLILDDPVQSMDDIHIAHFAALLRTLSKEHDRQILIAVHDRQLFEYLRLELSPAFPDDSLITLELNRSANRKTECTPHRYRFQEETALRVA
ncbi:MULTISPECIES: AAA family ATPase [Rhizobium]|uniref:AAA family ATPase n=1 Tax=Rhizobium TaxID=379 RepID=UPI0013B68670|nr:MULTISPECIES: AAA family ATPase [Rhizobium]MCH4549429.1 AAA family ATPase [Rhizobium changzhiense]NEI66272.1 AAA family ATPase [Rhizobium leguminosarum]NKN02800.1 AAA family ATPase [Rhizobium leguminosarum bv. viciae]